MTTETGMTTSGRSDAQYDEVMAELEERIKDLPERVKERHREITELAFNLECSPLMMDEYAGAVIGYVNTDSGIRVVYDHELCIKCLAESYTMDDLHVMYPNEPAEKFESEDAVFDMRCESANEWFECHTLRSLPYVKDDAPIIMERFHVDSE